MKRKKSKLHWFKTGLKSLAIGILSLWAVVLILFFTYHKETQQTFHTIGTTYFDGSLGLKVPRICQPYLTHAWRMNDRVQDHWKYSVQHGLEVLPQRTADIRFAYRKGKLSLITETDGYFVDTMYYSYAFALPYVKSFIDELSERFQQKLKHTDLFGTRFSVTSLLHTKASVQRLKKKNRNAIEHSTHLHGTTFDVSYRSFLNAQKVLNSGEIAHLKEVLATCLYELRAEQKCWVKYEIYQTCFHVVVRECK